MQYPNTPTSAQAQPSLISPAELLSQTFALVHKRKGLFAKLILAAFILYGAFFVIAGIAAVSGVIIGLLAGSKSVVAVGGLLALSLVIAGIYFGIRLATATLYAVFDSQMAGFRETMSKSKAFAWSYFLNQLLVGIITLAGFALLVIPGIYLSVLFSLSAWLIFDGRKAGSDNLRACADLMKGYWWSVLGRYIVGGIVYMIALLILSGLVGIISQSEAAASITQSVLSLITAPYLIAYTYLVYQSLKQVKKNQVPA